jgi:transcriptional regulator
MLIREHDTALSDAEWQDFLSSHDFGQLVVPRADQLPMIVPAHFVYQPPDTVLLHLARVNPVFEALPHAPQVVLAVIGAYTYIPVPWNAAPGTDPDYGIPTSYYGAVQLTCRPSLVDDAQGKAEVLKRQLAHFQPQGDHAPVEPGDSPFGRGIRAITAIRLSIIGVRAKFKFGGNKAPEHRRLIADRLAERAQGFDLEARRYLLQRLPS